MILQLELNYSGAVQARHPVPLGDLTSVPTGGDLVTVRRMGRARAPASEPSRRGLRLWAQESAVPTNARNSPALRKPKTPTRKPAVTTMRWPVAARKEPSRARLPSPATASMLWKNSSTDALGACGMGEMGG